MATLKNMSIEEQSVESRLLALKKLQETYSQIDKIRTLRGELPLEVNDLEDEIAGLETRLQNYSDQAKAITKSVTAEKNKIKEIAVLLDKYKAQMEHVRNNREYDNLSREVEFQELDAQLCEKRIGERNVELKQKKEEIATLKEHIALRKADYEQKKNELDNIIAETQTEEDHLTQRCDELEQSIDDRMLAAFKRIRSGVFNGAAVVAVDRNACGGCFNKIPPQRQLDVKLHKKVIVCEFCGRILVDPELGQEYAAE